jgi:hypothetical protein
MVGGRIRARLNRPPPEVYRAAPKFSRVAEASLLGEAAIPSIRALIAAHVEMVCGAAGCEAMEEGYFPAFSDADIRADGCTNDPPTSRSGR